MVALFEISVLYQHCYRRLLTDGGSIALDEEQWLLHILHSAYERFRSHSHIVYLPMITGIPFYNNMRVI